MLLGSDTNHNHKCEKDLLTLASSFILNQATSFVTESSKLLIQMCQRTGFEVTSNLKNPFLT